MITPDTPLWQLTVAEFMELMNSEKQPAKEKKYDYGIAGIARTFNCSRSTAIRIKNDKKYKRAIVQTGRKIVIDVDMALSLSQVKP